jgi:hypothetical protein
MGREEKSKKAMRRLVGNVRDYDIDHEYLVMKHHLAESQALMEKSSKLGWIACFKGTNLRRTLISTIPFSMQVGCTRRISVRIAELIDVTNVFNKELRRWPACPWVHR